MIGSPALPPGKAEQATVPRDRRTLGQREAYGVAHEFIQELAARLHPGLGYDELAIPDYPKAYREQRYSFMLHGVGTDDEPPFYPFPDESGAGRPAGEFRENMVVSVEFYAGKVGEQHGVKLEDEVWISANGPVMLSLYPYDEKLLA